jgi:hypothetical protein
LHGCRGWVPGRAPIPDPTPPSGGWAACAPCHSTRPIPHPAPHPIPHSQVGHLQALLQQVDGLLVRRPAPLARAQAAALGVAAAWRLGQWDELAEYLGIAEVKFYLFLQIREGVDGGVEGGSGTRLAEYLGTEVVGFTLASGSRLAIESSSHCACCASSSVCQGQPEGGGVALAAQEHLDVCVGRLLLALHGGKYSDVHSGLVATRADIMAILPAISQESYLRAYPHVARLHMLQEVQDVLTLMQERPATDRLDGGTLNQRFRWRERLAATQASLAIQEPLLSMRRQLADLITSTLMSTPVSTLTSTHVRRPRHPGAAALAAPPC